MKTLFETILGPMDQALRLIPMGAARWLTVSFLVGAAVGAWFLPRDYVFRSAPSRAWRYDLRLWASFITLPYVLIYLFL